MDWNTDLEITSKKVGKRHPQRTRPLLGFESLKQIIPRLGRRAPNDSIAEEKSEDEQSDSPDSNSPPSKTPPENNNASSASMPPRVRKMGWGDEFRSAKQSRNPVDYNDNSQSYSNDARKSIDEDIPVIPDLDEIMDDTSIMDLSSATKSRLHRAASYRDLETDLAKNPHFAVVNGVDLSLLVEKLYPESDIQEADEIWSWKSLFTQVASEINNENQSKSD